MSEVDHQITLVAVGKIIRSPTGADLTDTLGRFFQSSEVPPKLEVHRVNAVLSVSWNPTIGFVIHLKTPDGGRFTSSRPFISFDTVLEAITRFCRKESIFHSLEWIKADERPESASVLFWTKVLRFVSTLFLTAAIPAIYYLGDNWMGLLFVATSIPFLSSRVPFVYRKEIMWYGMGLRAFWPYVFGTLVLGFGVSMLVFR